MAANTRPATAMPAKLQMNRVIRPISPSARLISRQLGRPGASTASSRTSRQARKASPSKIVAATPFHRGGRISVIWSAW
jgi:hypothetical protein